MGVEDAAVVAAGAGEEEVSPPVAVAGVVEEEGAELVAAAAADPDPNAAAATAAAVASFEGLDSPVLAIGGGCSVGCGSPELAVEVERSRKRKQGFARCGEWIDAAGFEGFYLPCSEIRARDKERKDLRHVSAICTLWQRCLRDCLLDSRA